MPDSVNSFIMSESVTILLKWIQLIIVFKSMQGNTFVYKMWKNTLRQKTNEMQMIRN